MLSNLQMNLSLPFLKQNQYLLMTELKLLKMLLPPLLTLQNAWRINSRGAPTLAAGLFRTRRTQSTQEGSTEARRSQRLGRGGRAKGSCGQRALENEIGQICLIPLRENLSNNGF